MSASATWSISPAASGETTNSPVNQIKIYPFIKHITKSIIHQPEPSLVTKLKNTEKQICGTFALKFQFHNQLSVFKRFPAWDDKKYTSVPNIPRMMTDVVPSPTSSSWVRFNSIIDCIRSNNRTALENNTPNRS